MNILCRQFAGAVISSASRKKIPYSWHVPRKGSIQQRAIHRLSVTITVRIAVKTNLRMKQISNALVSNCKTIQFLTSLFLRVTIFLLRKSQNSQTFLLIDRIIRILIYKYINIYITRPINIFEFILARYRA